MRYTPPQFLSPKYPLTIAVLACFAVTSDAQDFNYIGDVNIHGNPNQGISNGTYENINVQITGVSSGYYTDTTEAVVIQKNTLTATKTVSIVNTAQHDNIDNNGAVYARDSATINFKDLDSIYIASIGGQEGRNDSTAISAKTPYRGISGLFDTYTQNNNVTISGKSVQIIGSIDVTTTMFHKGTNKVTVELSNKDSFWFGSAIGEGNDSIVDLTLKNGATWIFNASGSLLSDDGELSNLTLEDGVVMLADDQIWKTYEETIIKNTNYNLSNYRNKDAVYATVKLDNLKGSGGTFVMDLNWLSNQGQKTYANDGTSDFIQIGSAENGSRQVVQFDASKAHLDEMNLGDKLYFASVEEGDTTFTTNADGEVNNSSELYTLNYSTKSETDLENDKTYWYLTKSLGHTNENINFLHNATLASYSLATDLDRFHERRGETRHKGTNTDGLWVRYRFSNIGYTDKFDTDKHMIQIGYDKDVSTTGSRKIVGVAFDYTQADTDLNGISGSGNNDVYGLNFYYSVLSDCGGYADFNAKVGRIGSDYDLNNNQNASIGSSFWQTYYGLSAEVGYKYQLNNNLFIEPQTQLQIVRIEGDNFTTDGGIKANIGDINSIIGRLGFRSGMTISFGENSSNGSIYIMGDVMHEFKGDYSFDAIGRTTAYQNENSGSDTWYDLGIGTNITLSKNSKIWLSSKCIFGGEFDNSWQLNAGIRYSF